jgi:hypothetical protein
VEERRPGSPLSEKSDGGIRKTQVTVCTRFAYLDWHLSLIAIE